MLCLHLFPNGIWRFDAGQDAIFNAHFIQLLTNRSREFVEKFFTFVFRFSQLVFYLGVFFRMLILEAKVFEFGLDFVQTETVGQWRIDV